MTAERLQCIGAHFLISREQLSSLLPFQPSERLSTLGEDGKGSMTGLTDTLMQWYDTLPETDKAKFWTLTLDFFTLDTSLGEPSRDWS
jgi:hypothetical protein